MVALRRDVFTAGKPKRDRGRGSFYGVNVHTGLTPERLFRPRVRFTAALDDVYGPYVTFGHAVDARPRGKN